MKAFLSQGAGAGLALLDGRLDGVTLLSGLATFAGGILMMIQHLRQWQRIEREKPEERTRLFEWKKFRRRTLVAALVAACGAICTSLARAIDPVMHVALVTMLVLILILILTLALFDLAAVSLFQFSRRDRRRAHQELVDEIIRRQRSRQAAPGTGPVQAPGPGSGPAGPGTP